MKQQFLTVHEITDRNNLHLNPHEYSRFKHGSGMIAEKYGQELAQSFLDDPRVQKDLERGSDMITYASPWIYLPTASSALFAAFQAEVNKQLGREYIQQGRINKGYGNSAIENYSAMSEAEREEYSSSRIYEFDGSNIKQEDLVASIDDIKITGSHERRMTKTFGLNGVKNDVFHLTYATLMDQKIGADIENELNEYAFQGSTVLTEVQKIIADDTFVLNTRVCKHILRQDEQEFRKFIIKQDETFCNNLLTGATKNGYREVSVLNKNLFFLENHMK